MLGQKRWGLALLRVPRRAHSVLFQNSSPPLLLHTVLRLEGLFSLFLFLILAHLEEILLFIPSLNRLP